MKANLNYGPQVLICASSSPFCPCLPHSFTVLQPHQPHCSILPQGLCTVSLLDLSSPDPPFCAVSASHSFPWTLTPHRALCLLTAEFLHPPASWTFRVIMYCDALIRRATLCRQGCLSVWSSEQLCPGVNTDHRRTGYRELG